MGSGVMSDIRECRNPDLAAVLDLAVAFYAEDGFVTPRDRLERHLAQLAAGDTARVAVVDDDGTLLGFGITTTTFGLENGLIAELEDLFVAPWARRRGLAGRLIEDSARWSRRVGASQLEVVVAPNGTDVTPLLRYYRSRGFTDEGRRLLAMRLTD
jgi:ribosomal protein S18 acetylase RimI-like enzyme